MRALWLGVTLCIGCQTPETADIGEAGESASRPDGPAPSAGTNVGETGQDPASASGGEDTDTETTTGGESGDDGTAATCPSDLVATLTAQGVRGHLEAFSSHAAAHGGTRVAGGGGYDASATYIYEQLAAAGYEVSYQDFAFKGFIEDSPTLFEQAAPANVSYAANEDFAVIRGCGNGDVTAPVTAVDLDLGLGNSSTSGCQASDFDAFPSGHIALVQRGACTFTQKFQNAAAAGAAGVIIFNQGDADTSARQGIVSVYVDGAAEIPIPGVFVDYPTGAAFADLASPGALQLRLSVDATRDLETRNVFAETPGGDPNEVLMLGAHLDSVLAGPGINDNGSGSAALLEAALRFGPCEPTRKVRFAWWGAEESGLIGSHYYVDGLDATEADAIFGYLNFDMLGSVNFVRFVFDGDGSDGADPGPDGSGVLEAALLGYFEAQELPTSPAAFQANSDYFPFLDAGIATGGIATGAGGTKSDGQQSVFGGAAGDPFDPCYHQACDRLENVEDAVLLDNARAIAHALVELALPT